MTAPQPREDLVPVDTSSDSVEVTYDPSQQDPLDYEEGTSTLPVSQKAASTSTGAKRKLSFASPKRLRKRVQTPAGEIEVVDVEERLDISGASDDSDRDKNYETDLDEVETSEESYEEDD
jgi:hypothetical protein